MRRKFRAKYEGKFRLKKEDVVEVIAGRYEDKGKRGKIIETIPDEGKVVVDGVNIATKHQRPRRATRATPKTQTGLIHTPAPLSAAKVMLVCPKCSKTTRISMGVTSDGTRSRRCTKCNELID
ncbi:MAG TPA: 50S ribosomal protein L24 [Armatimonadota bacterium]|jgi:large subunit ribosomal protein L24|nr:50S ribosomal protein L24 [Armatimonadota bacterium]HOM72043.1 50S ribosomal protein L24 [Armatimonadota bacterium]HPP74561.1 50S ribosomal protein L24 [Armatimonadota bacterium]